MLERLKVIAISALFGAFLLSFGIAVWSASLCQSASVEKANSANNRTEEKVCEPFNTATFQSVGIWFLANIDPIAIATAVSAVASAVIAWFTIRMSRINANTLAHGREVERAYVFPTIDIVLPTSMVRISISNNGKTAAIVCKIAVVICVSDEMPIKPNYRSFSNADLALRPGENNVCLKNFRLDAVSGKVIYGRIYYTDIFKMPHSSGFIEYIMDNTILPVDIVDTGYREWN
jgi:hypothetical protein